MNKAEIKNYIEKSKFNIGFIPKELEKVYLNYGVEWYRNPNDSLARIELVEYKERQKIERERNRKLDTISNVYIPKDLNDCFVQLDIILPKKEREKIKKAGTDDLHFSLGLWIRNNWRIWGGSRLEKYFRDRSPYIQPDNVSSIILRNYYEWLNGNVNIAEEWEKENPVVKDME